MKRHLPLLTAVLAAAALPAAAQGYLQTNLVTDSQSYLAANGFAPAAVQDANLVNPWGMSYGPTGPFWVSDNGPSLSTLYTGTGSIVPLVVNIPTTGTSGPTGQVFNGSTNFGGNAFLFANENGTISGWKGSDGSNATVLVSASGASYTGVAISGSDLYAANSASGNVDVYNGSFGSVGSFTDPNANGAAPFNVQNIAGKLYVTYVGKNGSFVDTLDPTTDTFTRLTSSSALAAPWGLALAPTDFGQFSNDLLVGNFGNGEINAFDPTTGALRGTLTGGNGKAIVNPDLWGLTFGNGAKAGAANTLYFSAGIGNEQHGLLGGLSLPPDVPEPGAFGRRALGLLPLRAVARRRRA